MCENRALLSEYTALSIDKETDLYFINGGKEPDPAPSWNLLAEFRAPFTESRALFIECRVLFVECRPLSIEHRALFIEYRALSIHKQDPDLAS